MTYSNPKKACNTYQKSELTTLTPAQIIARLYQALYQDLVLAQNAMLEVNRVVQSEKTGHALAIVGELQANLNMEEGGEIAANLNDLYFYLMTEISKANIHNDIKSLKNAMKTVKPLTEAWVELAAPKKETHNCNVNGARPIEATRAVAFQATF
jgi:flagellar secretion chaperone FliS